MNIEISKKWWPFIRSSIQSGRYASEAEVLDRALRLLKAHELEGAEGARVEALLVEGLDSGPSTPLTSRDWDEIERDGQRIIAARKAHDAR